MQPKLGSFLDEQFINTLFSHPQFRARLTEAIYSSKGQARLDHPKINGQQLSTLTQQISSLLSQNYQYSLAPLTRHIQQEIATIHLELAKVRDSITFATNKVDFTSRQLFQEVPEEDEHFYDLPSIKRTIHFLQEKIKEISPDSSTLLESPDASKEAKPLEEYMHNRISTTCEQLQHRILTRHQVLEENFNKRLQKQQKTINNILETLNDINGHALAEKPSNTLSNSKSATKLKTFFGFR